MKKMKGKFFVIDGSDGSGKATQTKLLFEKLRKEKRKVKTIDFPQYQNNFFGKFIGECLRGEYGDFVKLNPKIASSLFAFDRFESKEKIEKWIKEGNIVIADRYVSANQIHQGGKIKNDKERKEFLKWLEKMEYEILKLPKPDSIFFLNVPIKISQKLSKKNSSKEKKKYLKGKKDQHESNIKFLENSIKSAIKMVKGNNNWIEIDCVKNNQILSREEIHKRIWEKVKKMI